MKFAPPVIIGIGLILGHGLAFASPQQSIEFDVPPQSMSSALNVFAKQSDLRVVFYTDVTDRMTSAPVRGNLTPESALKILLDGADLTYEFADDNSVQIWSPKDLAARHGDAQIRLAQGAGRATDSPSTHPSSATTAPLPDDSQKAAAQSAVSTAPALSHDAIGVSRGMPEVLVRGKKTLNMDIERSRDDARPYVVFDRAQIEQSGAQNLEEFVRKNLTSNTSAYTSGQINVENGGLSQIDLGGLGPDQTLILIDGRRVAGASIRGTISQPDVNGIPLSAIERVEVLRSSASGMYGGGATGGVVNIILRRDYSGTEARLTYESTEDGGATRRRIDLSGGYGFGDGKTSLLVSGSYSDTDGFLIDDRNLLRRARARLLSNDPGTFYGSPYTTPLGATTNIASSDGTPLTLKPSFGGGAVGSPTTSVPYGYGGPSSDGGAALIANAGRFNFDVANTSQTTGGRNSLLGSPTLKSLMATLRHDITPKVSAFLEAAGANSVSSYQQSSAPLLLSIDAGAANNPFEQSILVTVPIYGLDDSSESSSESRRLAGGLTAKAFGNWVLGVDYTWNRVTSRLKAKDFFDTSAAQSEVASGSIDIFRDVTANPVDFSSARYRELIPSYKVATTLKDASARLSGPLPFDMPGGAPVVSTALEYRTQDTGNSVFTNPTSPTTSDSFLAPALSQTVRSAYAEVLVPLASPARPLPFAEILELQVAGRYDGYETAGAANVTADANGQPSSPVAYGRSQFHSVDPTYSLRYKPVQDVMLRGSIGTGFLPPAAPLLSIGTPFQIPGDAFVGLGITDPLRNNEPVGASGPIATIFSGGDPNLRPEESRSVSAGLVLTPRFISGLRLSLDWTRIKKRDAIVQPPLVPELVSLLIQAAPDHITRAPDPSGAGVITGLNLGVLNFASSKTEAYDLALDYSWPSSRFGNFSISSSATNLVHSESQLTPISPVMDNAGVLNALLGTLKWRATASFKWSYRGWSAAWTTRYYDSYFVNSDHTFVPAQGSATVPSQTYHDLFVSYAIDKEEGPLSNLTVQGGVTNVFNKEPPFDAQVANSSRYSSVGDPRGATYFLSVRKSF